MSTQAIRLEYWSDETGYYVADEVLNYFAGGRTFKDLSERVRESAAAEGWSTWLLVPRFRPLERCRP